MNWNLSNAVAPKPWVVHVAGAALALGIAAAFYEGLYAPMQQEIADRTARIDLVRQLSTSGDQVAADHRRLTKRLDELKQDAAKTSRRVPSKVAPAGFVAQASRLAADYGLEVRQSQTGMPQHHATHSTVDVTYQLIGSYASTCRYLAAIDQVAQLTRVARLDVERGADSLGYPLQVTFQLYYRTDPNDKDEQQGAL
jgi:Tfp pilus assembly protein PilO